MMIVVHHGRAVNGKTETLKEHFSCRRRPLGLGDEQWMMDGFLRFEDEHYVGSGEGRLNEVRIGEVE